MHAGMWDRARKYQLPPSQVSRISSLFLRCTDQPATSRWNLTIITLWDWASSVLGWLQLNTLSSDGQMIWPQRCLLTAKWSDLNTVFWQPNDLTSTPSSDSQIIWPQHRLLMAIWFDLNTTFWWPNDLTSTLSSDGQMTWPQHCLLMAKWFDLNTVFWWPNDLTSTPFLLMAKWFDLNTMSSDGQMILPQHPVFWQPNDLTSTPSYDGQMIWPQHHLLMAKWSDLNTVFWWPDGLTEHLVHIQNDSVSACMYLWQSAQHWFKYLWTLVECLIVWWMLSIAKWQRYI